MKDINMERINAKCVVNGELAKRKSELLSRLVSDYPKVIGKEDIFTISNFFEFGDNFNLLEAVIDVLADPEIDIEISLDEVIAAEKYIKTTHSLLYKMKLLVRRRAKLKK
jgi:hypothetical protein